MKMSGLALRAIKKIFHGAKNRRRLILRNGRKACCVKDSFLILAESQPMMCTSYLPDPASVSPIFSYIRLSSTGLSTEAITTVLFFESAIQGYNGLTVNP